MAKPIDIRNLYLAIAGSLNQANELLERAAKESEFSYSITELDFSVPFTALAVEGDRVEISLPDEKEKVSEIRSLKFKVRFVPRTTVTKGSEKE
jgi:hypothetical protein